MAMSVVARAKIRNALKRGESIPDSWATDAQGRPTTDSAAALDGFLLPIGGHKGYGLALIVDLFAGLLSGDAYLTHVKSWSDAPEQPQNLGHFFILIDCRRLGSSDWLEARMKGFAAILQGGTRSKDTQPVIVPGQIELVKMRRQQREGVVLDAMTLKLLQQYASRTPA
jgi:ureidoglycolate dehydrogenase (NAD+)